MILWINSRPEFIKRTFLYVVDWRMNEVYVEVLKVVCCVRLCDDKLEDTKSYEGWSKVVRYTLFVGNYAVYANIYQH